MIGVKGKQCMEDAECTKAHGVKGKQTDRRNPGGC